MNGNKRFKTNPVLDHDLNPVPKDLKEILGLVADTFCTTRMRNLDIMDTSNHRLYGFLTHYHGGNFCWIQPTRTLDRKPEVDYDAYIKRINYQARLLRLEPLPDVKVGDNCVANYEADNHWYRALIVGPPVNNKWLVLFIDYGNLQRTSLANIMAPLIEPPHYDHFRAPLQAVCCRLYNVVPRHPDCRAEVDGHLESFFAKHAADFLEIKVKDVRPDYVVDCDVFLSKRATQGTNRLYKKHMGQEVINLGLATFADPEAAHAVQNGPESVITLDSSDDEMKPDIKPEWE